MWDIRQGIVGADSFVPKHAMIVTWKNMSFTGGITQSLQRTNTFQLVLATDEVFTYAIFNYLNLQWTSHTEAGGDTTTGENGVAAYVSAIGGTIIRDNISSHSLDSTFVEFYCLSRTACPRTGNK